MRDELPNLPPQDFMDFFRLCLTINTRIAENGIARIKRGESQAFILQSISALSAHRLPRLHEKILDETVHNPPEWFGDNRGAWKTFVFNHANFFKYLNQDFAQSLPSHQSQALTTKLIKRFRTNFVGATFKEGSPDWLLENKDVTPEREEVEKEITEDEEEQAGMNDTLNKIEKQEDYLNNTVAEKAKKANERVRQQIREVFPSFQNFSDVVLLAKVANTEAVNRTFLDEVLRLYTSSENVLTNQEPIALFIERKLKEGKMMQSAQDPIGAPFIDQFSMAFEHIKAQQKDGSAVAEFMDLRRTDKKAFYALNYDLKPFIEILTADEISLLQDLLLESKNKPIELFIWDMAGAISSRFKEKDHNPKPDDLPDFGKLTASFLRNHAGWAYEQLQQSLTGKDQRETSFESYEQPTSEIQQEIETTTEKIAQGNLAGWHIFYTDNRSLDDRHLTEVGGQTLEERERALQELLLKEQHLPSIKLGSIIRAFDWLVTIPEEIEQMRIKKDVAGETFRKLKRAGLRIFYNMDTQEKKLIFFLHQKQAMSYGF